MMRAALARTSFAALEVVPRLSRTARGIRRFRPSIRRLIDAPAGPPGGVTVVMTGWLYASPLLKDNY